MGRNKGCGKFQYTVFHVGANRVRPPSNGRAIMLAIPTRAYAIRPGKFVISGSLNTKCNENVWQRCNGIHGKSL
jgi:hypothetical protein